MVPKQGLACSLHPQTLPTRHVTSAREQMTELLQKRLIKPSDPHRTMTCLDKSFPISEYDMLPADWINWRSAFITLILLPNYRPALLIYVCNYECGEARFHLHGPPIHCCHRQRINAI